MTSAGDDDSDYTYSYDAAGNLTQVDNSGTSNMPDVVLDYTYDAAHRRTSCHRLVFRG